MAQDKKPTKVQNYSTISAILTTAEEQGFVLPDGFTYEDLQSFIDNEIALINKKADSAKKRAEQKKIEGDELRERVLNALNSDDYMSIPAIVAALDDPDVTDSKVRNRLTALGEKGTAQVEKGTVTVEGDDGKKKKIAGYKRIG